MPTAQWLKQPSVMLVFAIALMVQVDASVHLMNGLDVGWAWAWLLLPFAAVVEALFTELRLVVRAALVYWLPLPTTRRALLLLRLRLADAAEPPKCAYPRRARDSIP